MSHAIAVLGSASDVGKSLIATAICRMLADTGVDVVPFKAQNMGNQAGVTPEGLEMPRAQILQAAACRQRPHVDMGPVLMKPVSNTGAQIVVMGKAIGRMEAHEYFADTSRLAAVAAAALSRLQQAHGCVVLEGAGSPVELNLWDRDYVNLRSARQANAQLVLVLDIDKGGVFAQAKGTVALLPEADRARLLGVVINKFRGDLSLFESGIPLLEELCATKVLAVVPHFEHGLDEEDRPIRIPIDAAPIPGKLHVGVPLYPRVSNTEDLFPLLAEPDVQVTFLTDPRLVSAQQLILFPGSKSTILDLVQLTATGMAQSILEAHARGAWLLGICGGYQMLGRSLADPLNVEGGPEQWTGIGALPIHTEFVLDKITSESNAESIWPAVGLPLVGYEIHHGRTRLAATEGEPIAKHSGPELGWRSGRAVGSYLHGILAQDAWRSSLLNSVRIDFGLQSQPIQSAPPLELRLRNWTNHFLAHLRPDGYARLCRAAGLG